MKYIVLILAALFPIPAFAQLAPEIGYIYPPGGQAGTTVDVKLGGYDWTPDMQIFVHDPRVKLEIVGPPSPVLVPDPPYWFGAKGRGYAWPLPREFPARLTIAADVPPGPISFQVANANGASPPYRFFVGDILEAVEDSARKSPQPLSQLPVTVNGQIRLIEEIDRYEFTAARTGPITVELIGKRFGSMLNGLLKVEDERGHVVLDRADAEGHDITGCFVAQQGVRYLISLHDLDFAGDRSFVYRLTIRPGPQVLAAYPAGGKRGESREVEFVGIGLASGGGQVESLKGVVGFPADPASTSFHFPLETPHGRASRYALQLSNVPEHVKPDGAQEMSLAALPCAVTGSLSKRFGTDRFQLTLKKDERWKFTANARAIGSPLDLYLHILGPDGKELAQNDDLPDNVDPQLLFTAPADGAYTLVVGDSSGKSGTLEANYRLAIEPQVEDFSLTVPTQLAIPLGTAAKVPVKIERHNGFKAPIQLSLEGLPTGVTAAPNLTIPEGAKELPVELTSAADGAALASLATVVATTQIGGQTVTRKSTPVLVATTMKPRIKITPEGLDDVRKVHRGSTYLAPVLIERLEGYQGEITLEMTAKQQRHRQGLASGEFIVPPDATRVEYPIFVPEWMETTKTSRMILNGAVRVNDPKGNPRTLLQRQEMRIGILPEGALMKLSSASKEATAAPGGTVQIPLSLLRVAEFRQAAQVELVPTTLPAGVSAQPITLEPATGDCTLTLQLAEDPRLIGEHPLTIRATSLKDGKWPVVSETTVVLVVKKTAVAH